jgi:CRP-like cAMP-binding protein
LFLIAQIVVFLLQNIEITEINGPGIFSWSTQSDAMSNGGLISVGDIFGEAALHSQASHEFDIVAQGSVSLLVISRESVEQLCDSIEDILARTSCGGAAAPDIQKKELSSMTGSLSIEGSMTFSSLH